MLTSPQYISPFRGWESKKNKEEGNRGGLSTFIGGVEKDSMGETEKQKEQRNARVILSLKLLRESYRGTSQMHAHCIVMTNMFNILKASPTPELNDPVHLHKAKMCP